MDLDEALQQFDLTEANLERVEKVTAELQNLIPDGISFSGTSAEGLRYRELVRQFRDLRNALPLVDGFRIEAEPLGLDEIAQARLDAQDLGEPQVIIDVETQIGEPTAAIEEYRHRFLSQRRQLVRNRLRDLTREIDEFLGLLGPPPEPEPEALKEWADGFDWETLNTMIAELGRLLRNAFSGRRGRWGDLARHMSFAEPIDLRDVVSFDWPSVRSAVEGQLYSESEPLPVAVEDLAKVAESKPQGAVTSALQWSAIDDEGFERLIFNLINSTEGYENPQWLTKTRAPDRGRDLSVDRILADPLGDTRRLRTMIQCRHRHSDSVTPTEANEAAVKASLWKPPFDVLVIATTGRFTTDAVSWIENHNLENRLRIEMWPESRLEMLLADRPGLVEGLHLRQHLPGDEVAP